MDRTSELPVALAELTEGFTPTDQVLVNAVVAVVEETLAQESEERVVLARELAVGLLDLLGARVARHAEDLVVVGHGRVCSLPAVGKSVSR